MWTSSADFGLRFEALASSRRSIQSVWIPDRVTSCLRASSLMLCSGECVRINRTTSDGRATTRRAIIRRHDEVSVTRSHLGTLSNTRRHSCVCVCVLSPCHRSEARSAKRDANGRGPMNANGGRSRGGVRRGGGLVMDDSRLSASRALERHLWAWQSSAPLA